jgi:hypothetical protein
MPLQSSSIEALNEGGIARLGDDTHWWIAPGHLTKATAWAKGTAIKIEQDAHYYWKFRLQNIESGERVYAVRSQRKIRRARDAYVRGPN